MKKYLSLILLFACGLFNVSLAQDEIDPCSVKGWQETFIMDFNVCTHGDCGSFLTLAFKYFDSVKVLEYQQCGTEECGPMLDYTNKVTENNIKPFVPVAARIQLNNSELGCQVEKIKLFPNVKIPPLMPKKKQLTGGHWQKGEIITFTNARGIYSGVFIGANKPHYISCDSTFVSKCVTVAESVNKDGLSAKVNVQLLNADENTSYLSVTDVKLLPQTEKRSKTNPCDMKGWQKAYIINTSSGEESFATFKFEYDDGVVTLKDKLLDGSNISNDDWQKLSEFEQKGGVRKPAQIKLTNEMNHCEVSALKL